MQALLGKVRTAVRWRWHLAQAALVRAPRRLPADHRGVALTFDDGPHPVATPAILDALRDAGAVATFFVAGARAEEHPDLVRRMEAEGHAVGSHGFDHRSADVADHRRGHAALERILEHPVRLFRPPHGALHPRTLRAVRTSYRTWLWDVDPGDYEPGASADAVADAIGTVEPGSIVLLHDGLEEAEPGADLTRAVTVAALPVALARLAERGVPTVLLAG